MTRPLRKDIARELPFVGNRTGRRGAPRLRLAIPAQLTSLSGTYPCVLIDISRTGARIGLDRPLHKGADALLQIAGLEPFGMVVRMSEGRDGGTIGVVFDDPLGDDEVLKIRSYSEHYADDEQRNFRREVRNWVSGGR